MWYAIISEDVENGLANRTVARSNHLARLQALAAEGRLLVAGPHPAVDSEDPGTAGFTGSLVIAEFESLTEVYQGRCLPPRGCKAVQACIALAMDRQRQIQERLISAFDPVDLLIKDQSHLHAGHAGAKEGKGHYDIRIVSRKFTGNSAVQRHRQVYEALGDLMETDIHALKIQAKSPEEV